MEPIISPWFVYAIGVCDSVNTAMGILAGLFTIAAIVLFITVIAVRCDDDISVKEKPGIKWLVIIPTGLLCWYIATAMIPDRKTLIGMAVAQNVTKDRAIAAGKMAMQAHDAIKKDVLDLILAIKGKEDEAGTRK